MANINKVIEQYYLYLAEGIQLRKSAWRTEDTIKALELYRNGETCADIGERLGYPYRSVVAKLVNLKVYIKPEKPTKNTVITYMREVEKILGIQFTDSTYGHTPVIAKADWKQIVEGIKKLK